MISGLLNSGSNAWKSLIAGVSDREDIGPADINIKVTRGAVRRLARSLSHTTPQDGIGALGLSTVTMVTLEGVTRGQGQGLEVTGLARSRSEDFTDQGLSVYGLFVIIDTHVHVSRTVLLHLRCGIMNMSRCILGQFAVF